VPPKPSEAIVTTSLRRTVNTKFLDGLVATARARADEPALIHKHRGVWVSRRWRDVLAEIDRLAAGLRSLGLAPGDLVAVDGEITARLFLTAAAVLASGGRILAVPISASAEELDRVLQDPAVALVLGQGRETVAEWSAATTKQRRVPIIFDHATPDSRPPDEGMVTLDNLRGLGAPLGWAEGLATTPPDGVEEILWTEETTDWREGLDVLLTDWISEGVPLALPELLAAAARDRAEIGPGRWIASIDRIERVAGTIRERLPERTSATGRLVAGALGGSRTPWAVGLSALLRKRIGLARLTGVEVYGPPGRDPSLEARQLFLQLGVPLSSRGQRDFGNRPADAPQLGNLATGGAVS